MKSLLKLYFKRKNLKKILFFEKVTGVNIKVHVIHMKVNVD